MSPLAEATEPMFLRDPALQKVRRSRAAARDDLSTDFSRIRCPQCRWRPSASDRWCCWECAYPEQLAVGCGTSWNTFVTRGLCPGCGHQWRWTACLACAEWSLHDDWYAHGPE